MSVFGPLKVIWNGTTRYLRLALKEKKLAIWEVPLAMQTAWEAGHSPQNIQSGFRTTGQYPLLSSKKWLEDHPGATTMGEAMKPGAKPKMSAAANQIGEMIGFKPPAAIGENPRHPCVATEPSRVKNLQELVQEKRDIAVAIEARREKKAAEKAKRVAEKQAEEKKKADREKELRPILKKLKKHELVPKSGKVTLGSTWKYLRQHTDFPASVAAALNHLKEEDRTMT